MANLEGIIERFGTASQIQEFWWDMGQVLGEDPYNAFAAILKTEDKLRLLAQQESKAQEFLAKHIYKSSAEKHVYQKILQSVGEGYVFLRRTWYNQQEALPDGPLKRGFGLCRSHARWYMHPTLVQNCRDKGGCCARACGCCSRRASIRERVHGAGHCTPVCVCCMRTRGSKLKVESNNNGQFTGQSSEWKLGMLSVEMKQAILLGVGGTDV